jgi:TRAP-type C4-dicarboxylate transport system permease small subunit
MEREQAQRPFWVKAIEKASEWSGYISALAILVSTLIIVHQVSVRYFLGIPAVWQIETSMYLLLVTSFIGAAYGLKHDAHVGIDMVVSKFAPRFQKRLRIVTSALGILLCAVVGWRAWHLWWEATSNGWKSETILSTPLMIPYFILPLGMLLITLQFLVIIYDDWCWLKEHRKEKAITKTNASNEFGSTSIKTQEDF